MRKSAVAVLVLMLFVGTADAGFLQSPPPTERIPNSDFTSFYPRWLGWTNPFTHLFLQGGVWRISAGGNNGMSVAVDSRGVAHLVCTQSVPFANPETPLSRPEGETYNIVYKNTHSDAALAGGVGGNTRIEGTWNTLASSSIDDEFVYGADICVDTQDRIHIVWVHHVRRSSAEYYDIRYIRRDASGWSSKVILTAADAPASNVVYARPRIKVGTDGVVRVIAERQDLNIPESESGIRPKSCGLLYIEYSGIPTLMHVVPFDRRWGVPNGEPRLALTASNRPYVVWTEQYRVPKFEGSTERVDFTQVYWAIMSGGGFSGKATLGGAVSALGSSNLGPNVTVGPDDTPYFVYTRYSKPSDMSFLVYQKGESFTQEALSPAVPASVFGNGAVVVDSRNQVHVLWREAEILMHLAKVKNPNPSLPGAWSQQRPAVAAPAPFKDPDYQVNSVAISRNDVIHVAGRRYYTRTMEYGTGDREDAVMASTFSGAQVNLSSGNLYFELPLFTTSGFGPTQNLSLIYNSLDTQTSGLSPGWRFNLDIRLVDNWVWENNPGVLTTTDDPNEAITVFFGDGRPVQFHFRSYDPGTSTLRYLTADDEYGYSGKLERTDYGNTLKEYKLTTKHGEILWFNYAGRLARIQDALGNYLDITHEVIADDVGGNWYRLKEIVDQLGNGGGGRNSTVFEYEAWTDKLNPPRPIRVVDPAGRTIKFAYTGAQLTSVVFDSVDGKPTFEFEYCAADDPATGQRVGQLRRLLPPRGAAASPKYGWTCQYLPDGRLKKVEDPAEVWFPDGQPDGAVPAPSVASMTVEYDETQPVTSLRKTLLRDRRGFLTTFTVDPRRSLALAIQEPNAAFVTLRVFDQYSNLRELQDRWGALTRYTYQTSGTYLPHVRDNLIKIERPLGTGTGVEEVARYTYTTDGFNNVETETTIASAPDGGPAVSRITKHFYNAFGQRIQTNHPDVQLPNGQGQNGSTTVYEYDGPRKQLTKIINEEGHWTEFSDFDPYCGLPCKILEQGGTQPRVRGYESLGNLFYTTEPQGGPKNDAPGPTVYVRDFKDHIVQVVDPQGNITKYEYDLDSNLVTEIPPAGGVETTTYDKRGYVSGGTNPDGNWSQWVDAEGNVRRIRNLRGFETNMSVDYLSRVTETRVPGASTVPGGAGGGPAQHIIRYGHDLVENGFQIATVTQVGSPASRTSKTVFDRRGRQIAEIEADGVSRMEFFYNQQDDVLAQQQVYGSTVQDCTVYFRDARDRIHHVRHQEGPYGGAIGQTSHVYFFHNRAGSVVQEVDPLGDVNSPLQAHKTTHVYDARERRTMTIDGKGVVIREFAYGDDDLLIRESAPDPETKGTEMAVVAEYTYTPRKQLRRVQNRDGKGTTYGYGPLEDQPAFEIDALGRVKRTLYDSSTQHVSEMVDGDGSSDAQRTLYFWSAGLLTETRTWSPVTQSFDVIHRRFYDQANRLEREEPPGQAPRDYAYNDFSDVKDFKAGAKAVHHSYNDLGQATQSNWSGAYSVQQTRTFNGKGQMTSMSDGSRQRTMQYDTWKGTPAVESFSVGGSTWKVQTHGTNAAGQVTSLTNPEGVSHSWPVDENNRVIEKRVGANASATMTYTPGGLPDQVFLKSTSGTPVATTTFGYDGTGRKIRAFTTKAGSNEVVADYRWEYNDVDEVVKTDYAHLGAEFDRTRDAQGRVRVEVTPGNGGGLTAPPYSNVLGGDPTGKAGPPSEEAQAVPKTRLPVPSRTVVFQFDPAGNRTQETVNGNTTTFDYNEAGQLIKEISTGKTVEHEYDDWGNRTVRRTKVGTNTTTEAYGYDQHGRLAAYTNSATGQSMQYDSWPTGERYAKTDLNTSQKSLQLPRFDAPETEYSQTGSGPISLLNTYVQDSEGGTRSERLPAIGEAMHYLEGPESSVTATIGDLGSTAERVQDSHGETVSGGLGEPLGPAGWQNEPEIGASLTSDGALYVPERGVFFNNPDDYTTTVERELYESQVKARESLIETYRKASEESSSFDESLGYWVKMKEAQGYTKDELLFDFNERVLDATRESLIDLHEQFNPAVSIYKAIAGQDTRGNQLDWRERVLAGVEAAGYVAGAFKGVGGLRSAMDTSKLGRAAGLAKRVTGTSSLAKGVARTAAKAEQTIARCTSRTCFVAGTQVVTDAGLKKIEDIESGDRVLSKSDETGEMSYQSVLQTFTTHPIELVHVTYRLSDRPGEESAVATPGREHVLISTGEHPFWQSELEMWIPAKALRVGDVLATPGGTAQVIRIGQERAPPSSAYTTYNFEVDRFHTYFVVPRDETDTGSAVWVHNSGGPCPQLSKPGEELFVGTYNVSKHGNKKTGLSVTHTPHHVVQDAVSTTTHGRGITINIPKSLHEHTRSYRNPVVPKWNLRTHLAKDVKELRNLLNGKYDPRKVNLQLKELIRQNKSLGGFAKNAIDP